MSELSGSGIISRFQSTYLLMVLLLAYILSFIDRTIMAVLIGPIRSDLAISDTQIGLLHGTAFTIFYVIVGLPIARLADRSSRRMVISIGVFFWSLMTCLCGFAKSFASLFVIRMGVGVGEAALSPPTHSLLADTFSARRLPLALAVFSLGIPVGSGLAFIIGGWVYGLFTELGSLAVPGIGELRPWQLTFIAVGLPGFLIGLMLLLIKEPARKELHSDADTRAEIPAKEILKYIWQRRALYSAPFISISLLGILGYGTMTWYLEFMVRSFGVERSVVGPQFGMLFIVAGGLGTLGGGFFVGWLARRGYRDANFRIIMLTALAWLVPAVAGPLMPTAELALWSVTPTLFLFNFYFGGAFAGLQLVTPNRMRAQVSAGLLFVVNIAGLGLGPLIIGLMTNYLFGDESKLNYSLSLVALIVCPLAAWVAGRSLKHYRAMLDAEQAVAG